MQQKSPDCRSWILDLWWNPKKNYGAPGEFIYLSFQTHSTAHLALLGIKKSNTYKLCRFFTHLLTSSFHRNGHPRHERGQDEYNLVKNISARIQGLSPSVQLARRKRRLLAHGLLRQVGSNDRGNEADSSYCLGSIRHRGPPRTRWCARPKQPAHRRHYSNEWNVLRGRSRSVKLTASSATGTSFKTRVTMSSVSSGFPLTPPSDRFSSFCGVVSPPAGSLRISGLCLLQRLIATSCQFLCNRVAKIVVHLNYHVFRQDCDQSLRFFRSEKGQTWKKIQTVAQFIIKYLILVESNGEMSHDPLTWQMSSRSISSKFVNTYSKLLQEC